MDNFLQELSYTPYQEQQHQHNEHGGEQHLSKPLDP